MLERTKRRVFSAEQKADAVRRHLIQKVPVSNLADELGVQPTQIHGWIKLVLDQAEKAFERSAGRAEKRETAVHEAKIAQLEAKLVKKNEAVAELMEAHVQLKKELGEL